MKTNEEKQNSENTLQYLIRRVVNGDWDLSINHIVDAHGFNRIAVRSTKGSVASLWDGSSAEWQDALTEYFANQFATELKNKYTRI
jgi:hypothetical protein